MDNQIYNCNDFDKLLSLTIDIEELNRSYNIAIENWDWSNIYKCCLLTVRNLAAKKLQAKNIFIENEKFKDRVIDITINVISRLKKEEAIEKETKEKFSMKNIPTFHYSYILYLFSNKYKKEDKEDCFVSWENLTDEYEKKI